MTGEKLEEYNEKVCGTFCKISNNHNMMVALVISIGEDANGIFSVPGMDNERVIYLLKEALANAKLMNQAPTKES